MSDLHHALGDIGNIRRQVAQATQFRGYGPATLALTGVAVMLTACAQAHWLPNPAAHLEAYLRLWIGVAVVCATLTAVQVVTRTRRMHSGLSNQMLYMAVEQFLPSAGAGLLLTIVLANNAPASCWMLPGLWLVLYGLGVFSSCRFLPRHMRAAGVWFVCSGLCCLALGDARALSPSAMGVCFGVGQLLVAAILFFATSGPGRRESAYAN